MGRVVLFLLLLLSVGCDKKEQVKYVAQSAYDELELKYEKLTVENERLHLQNIKLNNQNELLRHDLEKYTNGFKSMYE